jgi:hypothetical protein
MRTEQGNMLVCFSSSMHVVVAPREWVLCFVRQTLHTLHRVPCDFLLVPAVVNRTATPNTLDLDNATAAYSLVASCIHALQHRSIEARTLPSIGCEFSGRMFWMTAVRFADVVATWPPVAAWQTSEVKPSCRHSNPCCTVKFVKRSCVVPFSPYCSKAALLMLDCTYSISQPRTARPEGNRFL